MLSRISSLIILLLCSGCSAHLEHRGHSFIPEQELSEIKIGKTDKQSVVQAFGTPTFSTAWNENHFVYAGILQEQKLFFDPETIKQEILLISFDDHDNVKSIDRYYTDTLRHVDIESSATPLRGNEVRLFEQMLGNIGRFNAPQNRNK